MKRGSGNGMCLDSDGYLKVTRRGPNRNRKAHRVYMESLLGRPLREDEEVHHLCRNRSCWPPTDGHLLLLSGDLHAAIDGGREPHRKWRARQNHHLWEGHCDGCVNETAG